LHNRSPFGRSLQLRATAIFLSLPTAEKMHIHIEVFAFQQGQAHGAIWLDNGTAIPISMRIDAYETAKANGLFARTDGQDDLFPDHNGVLNESNRFYNLIGLVEQWLNSGTGDTEEPKGTFRFENADTTIIYGNDDDE
jgi:hypothetical protein